MLNRNLVPLLLALAAPAQVLAAQAAPSTRTGTIRVLVKDPSGRLISGAHVQLRGPGLARTESFATAADGSLTVSALAPGNYTLILSQPGFAKLELQLQVLSGEPMVRAITLPVSGATSSVQVIASSPIGGLDVPLSDIPVPVQSVTSQTIEDTNAIDLTDTIKRRLNGVFVNENQNNPFQPDVNYRGFTASPLLGTPQGLSVYLDGVRQNQPFGDVVSWELIPKIAIADMELIPGSNPVYGLNTLGGAIAVQTKNGLRDAGFRISSYGGSFGRRALEGEYGGSTNSGLNWYAGGTLFHEDGWRTRSPSGVRQSFVKLAWNHDRTSLSLSGGYALSSLTGNGSQDFRTLGRTTGPNTGFNSVYSIPDTTQEHSPFFTFNLTRALSSTITLNGNAYFRYIRTDTANGDINDDSFDQSLYSLTAADKTALTAAGIPYPIYPLTAGNTPVPYLRCVAQGLEHDKPGEKCTGIDTSTTSKQHAYGASAQLAWRLAHNQLAFGFAWDHGSLLFLQSAQYGYLNPDQYSLTLIPAYVDGSTSVDDEPQDSRVNLHGATNTPAAYATDTLTLGKWVLNASARYNYTTINNADRMPAVSYRGNLTAINSFQRFNPSAGLVYKPTSTLNAYFDYSESSRAPTSTELGCANPDFPCNLPNALVSDPPLKQVHTRTVEGGLRGNPDGSYRWEAGYFQTDNYDDLLFVASQRTGYGYFLNFGQTRRQGVEANVSAHLHNFDASAEYAFLNATYQSPQTIESDNNSSNSNALAGFKGLGDGGLISILPGDHIPEIPQHMLKLSTDSHPLRRLFLNADFNLISSAYVRGNENNLHQPDGVYYLGSGKSPGYGVVNLGSRYRFGPHFELFAQINNLLNRHYFTAGQLAATPYDDNGNFTARPFAAVTVAPGDTEYPTRSSTFLSPGAPFTVFGGLRVSFGTK